LRAKFVFEQRFEDIKKKDIINKDTIKHYINGFNNELFMYSYAKFHKLDPEKMNVEEWENTEEGRDWINYEIENCFEETINKFEYEIINGDSLSIWRKMRVSNDWLNHLQKQGNRLGIYWSWDPNAAEEHWGYNIPEKFNVVTIESSVNVDYINWIDTIRCNMDPSSSEEKEIRLFKNTPLKIISLKINNKNIDLSLIKNKLFKA
jgi:hypothetical protein